MKKLIRHLAMLLLCCVFMNAAPTLSGHSKESFPPISTGLEGKINSNEESNYNGSNQDNGSDIITGETYAEEVSLFEKALDFIIDNRIIMAAIVILLAALVWIGIKLLKGLFDDSKPEHRNYEETLKSARRNSEFSNSNTEQRYTGYDNIEQRYTGYSNTERRSTVQNYTERRNSEYNNIVPMGSVDSNSSLQYKPVIKKPSTKAITVYISVIEGEYLGKTKDFKVDGERSLFIGTDKTCDICFKDSEVLPRQAEIYEDGDKLYIRDLGRKSGTYLGGMRLHTTNLLRPNDEIGIGSSGFSINFDL